MAGSQSRLRARSGVAIAGDGKFFPEPSATVGCAKLATKIAASRPTVKASAGTPGCGRRDRKAQTGRMLVAALAVVVCQFGSPTRRAWHTHVDYEPEAASR